MTKAQGVTAQLMAKHEATQMLRTAARNAQRRGLDAHEAMQLVAVEFGAVLNREGRIDGWTPPAKVHRR